VVDEELTVYRASVHASAAVDGPKVGAFAIQRRGAASGKGMPIVWTESHVAIFEDGSFFMNTAAVAGTVFRYDGGEDAADIFLEGAFQCQPAYF
jgi:hypothetical protein